MSTTTLQPDKALNNKLDLRLESFFQGQCQAWGIFEARGGRITNHFKVLTCGMWNGEQLDLQETVTYSDGSIDKRGWAIVKTSCNTYEGFTEGLRTKAQGTVIGPHFRWKYKLSWRHKRNKWITHFDDEMWLQDANTLINRATISKYGIRLGQAWLFFRRKTSEPTA